MTLGVSRVFAIGGSFFWRKERREGGGKGKEQKILCHGDGFPLREGWLKMETGRS